MKLQGLEQPFVVIGENLHTTRVLRRDGKFITTLPGGEEAVRYTTMDGETRHLVIPEDFKRRQDFQEGRVKHIAIAVRVAMAGAEPAASEGMLYLRTLVERQVKAGADFLDVNIDEISLRPAEQIAAMRWVVKAMEHLVPVPLSIDSSNLEIIRAGIESCASPHGRPMLNSASLERIEALDLARARQLAVIITAAGETGMPQNTEERLTYACRMIDAALAKSIPPEDLYVDGLVFPISVDMQFGNHYLEAIRQLRARYGGKIHLTGGLSNVSFGLPCRRLVNEVFFNLAVDAGADSGIVDPVSNDLNHVFLADRTSRPYQLARDMLTGADRNCKTFLKAFRKGELEPAVTG